MKRFNFKNVADKAISKGYRGRRPSNPFQKGEQPKIKAVPLPGDYNNDGVVNVLDFVKRASDKAKAAKVVKADVPEKKSWGARRISPSARRRMRRSAALNRGRTMRNASRLKRAFRRPKPHKSTIKAVNLFKKANTLAPTNFPFKGLMGGSFLKAGGAFDRITDEKLGKVQGRIQSEYNLQYPFPLKTNDIQEIRTNVILPAIVKLNESLRDSSKVNPVVWDAALTTIALYEAGGRMNPGKGPGGEVGVFQYIPSVVEAYESQYGTKFVPGDYSSETHMIADYAGDVLTVGKRFYDFTSGKTPASSEHFPSPGNIDSILKQLPFGKVPELDRALMFIYNHRAGFKGTYYEQSVINALTTQRFPTFLWLLLQNIYNDRHRTGVVSASEKANADVADWGAKAAKTGWDYVKTAISGIFKAGGKDTEPIKQQEA